MDAKSLAIYILVCVYYIGYWAVYIYVYRILGCIYVYRILGCIYVNRILGCIYMLVRNIDFAHDGTDLEAENLGT